MSQIVQFCKYEPCQTFWFIKNVPAKPELKLDPPHSLISKTISTPNTNITTEVRNSIPPVIEASHKLSHCSEFPNRFCLVKYTNQIHFPYSFSGSRHFLYFKTCFRCLENGWIYQNIIDSVCVQLIINIQNSNYFSSTLARTFNFKSYIKDYIPCCCTDTYRIIRAARTKHVSVITLDIDTEYYH